MKIDTMLGMAGGCVLGMAAAVTLVATCPQARRLLRKGRREINTALRKVWR